MVSLQYPALNHYLSQFSDHFWDWKLWLWKSLYYYIMYEPYYYHFCIHYYYHYYLSMNLPMKSPYFVKKQFRRKARLFAATHRGGAFTWCVWRRVAGWVAGGCWDYDITIVMKWIIPENSLSNTSKLQMGNQVARKCLEVGLNLCMTCQWPGSSCIKPML